MRSKDITLSASLMAIYIAINVLGSATPIRVSSMMQSALFGLFWPYFSTRLNLTFQGLRVGYNLIGMVRTVPKLLSVAKIESVAAWAFFDWFVEKWGGVIDLRAIELLEVLSTLEAGVTFWIVMAGFLLFFSLVFPYGFYRYFKKIGLFKRLPSDL